MSIQIDLVNQTESSEVFAYITGKTQDGQLFLMGSDGQSLVNPQAPGGPEPQELGDDVAIRMGEPGSTTSVTVPTHFVGGRVWFSLDKPLVFLVNQGPALVEPSINPSDPNSGTHWAFAELSYDPSQLFANISYVDFVGVPVGMSLTNQNGEVKDVPGLPKGGLDQICEKLREQAGADGAPWDRLIVTDENGSPLRAISPNALAAEDGGAFADYYNEYIDNVWNHFTENEMTINTQSRFGDVRGRVNPDSGNFEFADETGECGTSSFPKPSVKDIWGCNSGPFAPGQSPHAMAIVPRLSAAFNRSTLLVGGAETQPNGVPDPGQWYQGSPANHYSRIVHEVEVDGRGYAFAYDDVAPDGGKDVAGTCFDPAPERLTVTIGGA